MTRHALANEGARSVVIMAVGRGLIHSGALFSVLLLSWLMDGGDYGRYVSIIALASFAAVLVEMGLGWLEMRYLAPLWRRGERVAAGALASSSWSVKMALDGVVALLMVGWVMLTPALGYHGVVLLWIGLLIGFRSAFTVTTMMQLPLGQRRSFVELEASRVVLHMAAAAGGYLLGGLEAAFAALALVHVLLMGWSLRRLRALLAVSPRRFDGQLLWPHRRYIGWAAVTAILAGAQGWLPIFLLGGYLQPQQAAVLGVGVQVLNVLQGLAAGMRQGLLPILADFHAGGEAQRSLAWSALLLRLSSFAAGLGLMVWVLWGQALVALALPAVFAPVYQGVALALAAFLLLNIAGSCDGLLNLTGRSGWSALNLALMTAVTLAGALLVVARQWPQAALLMAAVLVLAALLLAVSSWLTLGLQQRLWLPLGRTVLLLLPPLLMLPLAWNDAAWPWWSVLPVALGYGLYAVLGRLLSVAELRRLLRALRLRPAAGGVAEAL
jgi:O-antigen/teichoic acid export membrane protein